MISLLNQKRKNDDFSGYSASALDQNEYTQTEYPSTHETNEETYKEIEEDKEKEGMKPAPPKYSPEEKQEPYYTQPEKPTIPSPTKPEIQPVPVYPEYPTTPPVDRIRKEEVEALIEQIIEEKWGTITAGIGDINIWKEKVRTEIISIKQELLRLEHRFEEINKAIAGKVTQYDKSIKSVGADVKAIEKLLQKILQPLTSNIKELQRLTTKLKK